MNARTLPVGLPEGVQELARTLKRSIGASAVWLFGSHARHEAGPDSDIDILAVVDRSELSRYARAVQARRAVADIRLPKDIVVLTSEEWTAGLRAPCSLASTVAREGVQIL